MKIRDINEWTKPILILKKKHDKSERVHHSVRRAIKNGLVKEDIYVFHWHVSDRMGGQIKSSGSYRIHPYIGHSRSLHTRLLNKLVDPKTDVGFDFKLGRWLAIYVPSENMIYRKLSWKEVGESRTYSGPHRSIPLESDRNKPLTKRQVGIIEEYHIKVDNPEIISKVRDLLEEHIRNMVGV